MRFWSPLQLNDKWYLLLPTSKFVEAQATVTAPEEPSPLAAIAGSCESGESRLKFKRLRKETKPKGTGRNKQQVQ